VHDLPVGDDESPGQVVTEILTQLSLQPAKN
jgi:hypothetical protein